jgi:CRP/FNR family transcriptional regulator, anaerobic regulatory protein
MKPRKLLYDHLIKHTQLTDDEVTLLCSFTTKLELAKNNYFQKEGSRVTRIGFLVYGIIKEEITSENGRKSILRFIRKGEFLADYGGYIQRRNTSYSLCAVNHCKLVFIMRDDLERLKVLIPSLEQVLMNIACQTLVAIKCEQCRFRLSTPIENYHHLLTCFRDIVFQLSMCDIASYLNITPSSFSRLKRNYFK